MVLYRLGYMKKLKIKMNYFRKKNIFYVKSYYKCVNVMLCEEGGGKEKQLKSISVVIVYTSLSGGQAD